MAAFTSKTTGNWSASGQTTWNETGVPGSGDTVSTSAGHVITVDVDTTFAGTGAGKFLGNLVIASGKKLTTSGNAVQESCDLTFNASSELLIDTSGGNRTWQLNRTARILTSGTGSATRAKITKTGGNKAWMPAENTFNDDITYDVDYITFTGLANAANTESITGRFTGNRHMRMLHVTFDSCGLIFGEYSTFDITTAFDYRFEDFVFTNPLGTAEVNFRAASASAGGSGVRMIKGGTFNKVPAGAVSSFKFEDLVFDGGNIVFLWQNTWMRRCLNVQNDNTDQLGPSFAEMTDCYMLADHVDPADRENGTTHVGNPHFLGAYAYAATPTYTGIIFEYPHANQIDDGDGIYGTDGGGMINATIQRCIILPSVKDGFMSTNLHAITKGTTGIKLYHNTIKGRRAQLVFNERSSPSGQVSECKSNLIDGVNTGNEYGMAMDDLLNGVSSELDIMTPAGITYNYIHNPIPYTDPATSQVHNGFRCRLSSVPGGTNILETDGTGPQFVDAARNILTWGVSKALYASADFTNNHNKRVALDAVRVYLKANPYLVGIELIPWIRDGFSPQNAALTTGHDGEAIGAVPLTAGPPPDVSTRAMVLLA